jgi:hypothetical protein
LEAWKQAGGLLEPLKKKMLFLDKTLGESKLYLEPDLTLIWAYYGSLRAT